MSNVYFVRTAHHYMSYDDLFTLAELSGYPVIPLSELDPQSDNIYILSPLNGEWVSGWDKPCARIIHWELEWRWDWRAEVDTPPGVAETWASDPSYAKKIGARYVTLGSHCGLHDKDHDECGLPPLKTSYAKKYDIAFMAYIDPARRRRIADLCGEHGLTIAPNGWGYARWLNLVQSRLMLHIHQHDNLPYIAPLRWAIAAAYSLPLISETVEDRTPFGYSHFMTCDYDHLVDFTVHWLRDRHGAARLQDMGRALHSFLCVEHTFRKCVEAAL